MNLIDWKGVGERFRTAREMKGLSQGALGERAGLSRWSVLRVEAGRLRTMAVLEALAKALEVELSALLFPPNRKRVAR